MSEKAKKDKLAVKDFVSLVFSAVAIAVSFGTAYFNILRVEEHVSIIIRKDPIAFKSADGNNLYVRRDQQGEFLYVNSGNRPAVILWVEVIYVQPDKPDSRPDCSAAGAARFRADFSPIVVKPNDVAASAIKIGVPHKFLPKDLAPQENGELFTFPARGGASDNVLVDVCLDVAVAVPSTSLEVSTFPILRYHAAKGHWYWNSGGMEGPLVHEPKTLISKTYTIFSN